MNRNSLAFRLFVTALIWTMIVLPVAGFLLYKLYRDEVEKSFEDRLELALTALIAVSINEGSDVPVVPKDFGDELFNLPLTGWYWQVQPVDTPTNGMATKPLISASLVGETLDFPYVSAHPYRLPGYQEAEAIGPDKRPIRMLERQYVFGAGTGAKRYSYVVTGNLAEIAQSVAGFRNSLALTLSVLGAGLVAATLFQVRFGLRPLAQIEQGLSRIRSGEASRLEGELPAEIVPLQRELNELIQSNQDIIERSRTHVGNLAHALKTPLSVITNEARTENTPFARKVAEQATIMRDQVSHHLDRARMVARTGVLTSLTEVKPVVEGLTRTLQRIYGERGVTVECRCPEGIKFQGEKQDLEEMLGNLLDNACKWSKSRVRLDVEALPSTKKPESRRQFAAIISDDGPGLKEAERLDAVKRGRRLDESKPGSGLGLSIVTDLVGLYGGQLQLGKSALGGLEAKVLLPLG